jgi:class 3 adenylate cyclase
VHREELIDPLIAAFHGRIVKTTGDGILAEFASVVDAIGFTVAAQRGMAERNANVPLDRRIVFRAGINVGDIIVEGDDIYGDGVNVAARMETLAEPGGICISGAAYDQVRDKLPFAFADRGEQTVKNYCPPGARLRVRRRGCGGPGDHPGSSRTDSAASRTCARPTLDTAGSGWPRCRSRARGRRLVCLR